MRNAILTLALLSMAVSAFAEEKSGPTGPLVTRTPADGAWSFKLQLSPPKSKKDAKKSSAPTSGPVVIAEVKTTQTGRLRLEEITYSDARVVQNWYVEGTLLLTDAGEGKVTANMIEPNWDRTSIVVPAGFAGFTWIKKEDFSDAGEFEEHSAYHYKRALGDGLELEAWVDRKSNLPLAFRAGFRTYVYTFASERPAPLMLPASFQAVEQKLKAEIEYRKTLDQDLKPAG